MILNRIPRRKPDVNSTLLPDGQLVLFDLQTDLAHTVNTLGALIWEFSDGEHSIEQIHLEVAAALKESPAAPANLDELPTQVENFVQELIESGLLVLD